MKRITFEYDDKQKSVKIAEFDKADVHTMGAAFVHISELSRTMYQLISNKINEEKVDNAEDEYVKIFGEKPKPLRLPGMAVATAAKSNSEKPSKEDVREGMAEDEAQWEDTRKNAARTEERMVRPEVMECGDLPEQYHDIPFIIVEGPVPQIWDHDKGRLVAAPMKYIDRSGQVYVVNDAGDAYVKKGSESSSGNRLDYAPVKGLAFFQFDGNISTPDGKDGSRLLPALYYSEQGKAYTWDPTYRKYVLARPCWDFGDGEYYSIRGNKHYTYIGNYTTDEDVRALYEKDLKLERGMFNDGDKDETELHNNGHETSGEVKVEENDTSETKEEKPDAEETGEVQQRSSAQEGVETEEDGVAEEPKAEDEEIQKSGESGAEGEECLDDILKDGED